MAAEANAATAPPVEAVVGEVVATLAFAAHAYLGRDEDTALDLASAALAIELAAAAFERIEPRLSTEERSALARLLTDLKLSFVRKRGS